jgi:hypothetical protein
MNDSVKIPETIGKYKIGKLLSRNRMTISFAASDAAGKRWFLKAYDGTRLTRNMTADMQVEPEEDRFGILCPRTENVPMETAVVHVGHPHLLDYADRGVWYPDGEKEAPWPYLVTEWVDGIRLSDYTPPIAPCRSSRRRTSSARWLMPWGVCMAGAGPTTT